MASIDEAKQIIKDTPISSVIGYYYPLNKRGATFEAICPFHSDTKPSLKINDNKGVFKCFACGAAGDSIKFVQDYKNLDFIEAVKDIAHNIGVPIDEYKKKQNNPKFEMAFRVLTSAFKFYKKVANESKPKGFTDFVKKRQLTQESIDNFGLGFAPANNVYLNYLNSIPNAKDKASALNIAKEIGIIKDSHHGSSGQYDFFRDRVIFPICDHSGQVRGFQARTVLADQKAKYMNSAESFIFNKGNVLYGFNIAKNHIRQKDSVIIAEGNMDVVVLHQYGFNNSVGTMGVAFSENSARLLVNMTKNIYLGMDTDQGGLKGMERINEMLLEKKILAKYINFAPSKDPDEFLQEFGRLELDNRIENAPSFIDFQIESIIPDPVPQTIERKLAVLKDIFTVLSPLKNDLIAKEKAINAANSLGMKSSNEDIIQAYLQLLAEQEQVKSKYKKMSSAPMPAATAQEPPPYSDDDADYFEKMAEVEIKSAVHEPPLTNDAPTIMQKLLIEELISHPECLESKQMTELLDFIGHPEVQQLVQWLKKIYLEIDDSDYDSFIKAKLEEQMHPDLKNVIASGLFSSNKLKLNKKVVDKMLIDFKKRLQIETLVREKKKIAAEQKNAVTNDEINQSLQKIQVIGEKIQSLKNKRY